MGKLKATGKRAALNEYNKLKSGMAANLEGQVNNNPELEDAACKAAVEALQSDSKTKEDGIQSEEDKAQLEETLKAEVEKSGIKAAAAEVDSFNAEEDVERSEEEIEEERLAMEESGRLAASVEYLKLARRSEESFMAGEQLAERQATAIQLVKTAACHAANHIFNASIVDSGRSEADAQSEAKILDMLEAAGLDAAEAGFVQFKSSGKTVEEKSSVTEVDQIERDNNNELKEKLESVSRKAAQDEFARLKAAAQRFKDLCILIESAVKKEASSLFSQLQREVESESDATIAERFEELGVSVAQDVQDIQGDIVSLENEKLSGADAEKAQKFGKRVAREELARLKAELKEASDKEANLLVEVEETAREAARQLFASHDNLVLEKDATSETGKLEEAEKAGIASAAKVFADCYPENSCGSECDGVNETNDLKDKMESLCARVAKEEFSRLAAEAEDSRKEHRFKSLVEEAARFAARAVFSMMTSEEKEASGGENVDVYDAERDEIFEEEIMVAGEEAALAEFDEFLRIEEMNNGILSEKSNVDEETERLEVALLGKEAALKEYKLLREELEKKIRESRLKAEEEAEAAKKLAEEEAKLAEEERMRAEDEERRRAEEEGERMRLEEEEKERQAEEDRLKREEEEKLRREEEETFQREEEERLRREEEERLRLEEEERLRREREEELRTEEEERRRAEEEERLRREEEERQRREEEERLRKEEEERLRKEEEERVRAEEEERLRRAEEEKLAREEEERVAAASALKEIQERLERQKAAAEARRLAAKQGDVEESIELIEFRRAQEEMRRACEDAVISLQSQKGKEANQATWLAFVLASL